MRALSLLNVKGGVGKTTTAVNLAASFAGSGLRTLLVDLDPQGSATISVGYEPVGGSDAATVVQVLLDGAAVVECAQPTDVEDLDVLCSSTDLVVRDRQIARKKTPSHLLRDALRGADSRYDLAVIDCPPGLGTLVEVALGASTGFLVPVTPQPLAIDALDRIFAGIEALGEEGVPVPDLLGVVLTMVDHRTKVTDSAVAEVRRRYGRKVLQTEIPINIQLAVAPERGRTIFGHEGWSTGGAAYRRLGGEVLRRARRRGWV